MFSETNKKKNLTIKKKYKIKKLSKKLKKKKGSGKKNNKNNFINNLFLISKLGLGVFLFSKLIDGYVAQKKSVRELCFPHDQIEDLQEAHKKLRQCFHNLETYESLVKLGQTEYQDKDGHKSNLVKLLIKDIETLSEVIIVLNNNFDASKQNCNEINKIIIGYENIIEHLSFDNNQDKKELNNLNKKLKKNYKILIDKSSYLEDLKKEFKIIGNSQQDTIDQKIEDIEKKLSPLKEQINELEQKMITNNKIDLPNSKHSKSFSIFQDIQDRILGNNYKGNTPKLESPIFISSPDSYPTKVPASSPPKVPVSSPPKVPASSPPKVPVSSHPKVPVSSPPMVPASSPPKVPASSPPSPVPFTPAKGSLKHIKDGSNFPNKFTYIDLQNTQVHIGPNNFKIRDIYNDVSQMKKKKLFKGNENPPNLNVDEKKELDDIIENTINSKNINKKDFIGNIIVLLYQGLNVNKGQNLHNKTYNLLKGFSEILASEDNLKKYFERNFDKRIFDNLKKDIYKTKKDSKSSDNKEKNLGLGFDRFCIGSILILTHYLK